MTLEDIFELKSNPELLRRVHGALVMTAYNVLGEEPSSTARQDWAKSAIKNPDAVSPSVVAYVLAANREATVKQVLGAEDSAYELNVANAVTALVGSA